MVSGTPIPRLHTLHLTLLRRPRAAWYDVLEVRRPVGVVTARAGTDGCLALAVCRPGAP